MHNDKIIVCLVNGPTQDHAKYICTEKGWVSYSDLRVNLSFSKWKNVSNARLSDFFLKICAAYLKG